MQPRYLPLTFVTPTHLFRVDNVLEVAGEVAFGNGFCFGFGPDGCTLRTGNDSISKGWDQFLMGFLLSDKQKWDKAGPTNRIEYLKAIGAEEWIDGTWIINPHA